MPNLPGQYAELSTKDCPPGRCHFFLFVNHPTPSGCDRPWLAKSSAQPVLTEKVIQAMQPGLVYFLDGAAQTRDDSPVIPYTEDTEAQS